MLLVAWKSQFSFTSGLVLVLSSVVVLLLLLKLILVLLGILCRSEPVGDESSAAFGLSRLGLSSSMEAAVVLVLLCCFA